MIQTVLALVLAAAPVKTAAKHVVILTPEVRAMAHISDTVVIPLYDAKADATEYGNALKRVGKYTIAHRDATALRKVWDVDATRGEAFRAVRAGMASATVLLTLPKMKIQCVSCRTAHYFVTVLPGKPDPVAQTASGIALDAPWKVTIYNLAHSTFKHPAWGWQHSERNYRLGMLLARGDHLPIDTDVLFAAAFLHDMAAFQPCADKKMEHGDCAAIASEAILRSAGFPMQKYAAVAAAERGHMYYRDPGSLPEAIVLHDADSLDFLGAIGAARMLALTGADKPDFAPAVKSLRAFLVQIPSHLVTKTAKTMAVARVAELRQILDALDRESFGQTAM